MAVVDAWTGEKKELNGQEINLQLANEALRKFDIRWSFKP